MRFIVMLEGSSFFPEEPAPPQLVNRIRQLSERQRLRRLEKMARDSDIDKRGYIRLL